MAKFRVARGREEPLRVARRCGFFGEDVFVRIFGADFLVRIFVCGFFGEDFLVRIFVSGFRCGF